MNTFLGINTIRVDLGPVDLLRARIMEQASQAAWTATEIEEVENEFTSVFTVDERPDKELLPFASAVLACLDQYGHRIFPSWHNLERSDVDRFLDFVNEFKGCSGKNGYFDEIRACGSG